MGPKVLIAAALAAVLAAGGCKKTPNACHRLAEKVCKDLGETNPVCTLQRSVAASSTQSTGRMCEEDLRPENYESKFKAIGNVWDQLGGMGTAPGGAQPPPANR